MRRKAQEITDIKILERILNKCDVLRLAIVDDEYPYILPLNYGYKDHNIYIHCAKEGMKIDLLKKNNKVSFEVEERAEIVKAVNACDWSTKYRSIIGHGEVEFIENFDQKIDALNILMQSFGGPEQNHFEDRHVNAVLILKIKITEMTGKQSKVFEV